MCVDGEKIVAECLGKAVADFGILIDEVVLLTNIVGDVVEFVGLIVMEVDEFPFALPDGAVCAEARAGVSPVVWVMPKERSI